MYIGGLVHVLGSIVDVQGSRCRPQCRPRLRFRPPCICPDSFRLLRLLASHGHAARWRWNFPEICPSPLGSSAPPEFSLIAFCASFSGSETRFSPTQMDLEKVVIYYSVHVMRFILQGHLRSRWFFKFSCFTCVSERLSAVASSTRSGVERYRCISKRFSSPESCESEKTVRAFLRRQCFPGNSGWCWNNDGICTPLRG